MDKIRSKLAIEDDILPTPYWDLTKSGKVLELRVKPTIDQQPGNYRLGVIQIGRIISRIQTVAKLSGSRPQIQLFPNLSENQLAATIYWPGFLESSKKAESQEVHWTPLTDADIHTIARHYNLSVTPDESLASDDETHSAYYLKSKSNQPFIWLKVGQFIQDITEQVCATPTGCSLTIDVLTTYMPDKTTSTRKSSYKQAKIYVTRLPQSPD